MELALSLDDEFVEKVQKIATERETTLAELVREYLVHLASEYVTPAGRQRQRELLLKHTIRRSLTLIDNRRSSARLTSARSADRLALGANL